MTVALTTASYQGNTGHKKTAPIFKHGFLEKMNDQHKYIRALVAACEGDLSKALKHLLPHRLFDICSIAAKRDLL